MEQYHAIGRRKTSVARIYLVPGSGNISVNGKELNTYFPLEAHRTRVRLPFDLTETIGNYDIKATVRGGGITGQADAVAMAASRALLDIDAEHRTVLKANDLLTRDPRMVERKKYGQKKARKSFQFSKR